jgi:hypothetical protein
MTSARAYLTTNVASSREATQDSVALLRSMTRKDERHYSPKLSGVGRSGKRTSHEGALQAVSASAESASGERLIPLRRRAKCFSPLPLSRSRWVSSGLASLIIEMTPLQHTHTERRHHPRSIIADLVIWCSGNLPGPASKPSVNTRLGGGPDPRRVCRRPVVYCCRVRMG